MTDQYNPYQSPASETEAVGAPASPDNLVDRGRMAYLGIVAFLLFILVVLPPVFGAELPLVRLALTGGLLFAVWRGHGWAITLLALQLGLGILIAGLVELPAAIVTGSTVAIAVLLSLGAAYAAIVVAMVRSQSLNAFFKHQEQQRLGATLVAPTPENRRNVVTLTSAAAELARQIIADRRFSPETALRVVIRRSDDRRFDIEYDIPLDDDRDWVGECSGVTVLVEKAIASELEELTIDAADGQYVFRCR